MVIVWINCACNLIEPVGFKKPSFTNDALSTTYGRIVGQSFGLLCQAQAFPTPAFRYDVNCCK